MLEQIQLWCAKHSSGLGPTVCTGRICSADSLRFRWSRQPRQSQFYTDELLHIILGVGNRMCRPLAVLSIKGGTAFLERHLRNKLIITRIFSSALIVALSFCPRYNCHFSSGAPEYYPSTSSFYWNMVNPREVILTCLPLSSPPPATT